jgi:hypothetical protein
VVVLGLESKHGTTWATPPALWFIFCFWHRVSLTLPRLASNSRFSCLHLQSRCVPTMSSLYWIFFVSGDRVSLCSPEWPRTQDPHASASWVLGLQVCTTMPGSTLDHFKTLVEVVACSLLWFSLVWPHFMSHSFHPMSSKPFLHTQQIPYPCLFVSIAHSRGPSLLGACSRVLPRLKLMGNLTSWVQGHPECKNSEAKLTCFG